MSRLRKVTYRCQAEECRHQFEHWQGAHRPGERGGPPDGCPVCGGLYLTWLDWYVVHTAAKAEPVVSDRLVKMGYSTLFLHYIKEIRHARSTRWERRAYFPRYLFVGVPVGYGLYDVNNTPGVSTVLHSDGKPLRLDEAVVDKMRAHGDEIGFIERLSANPDKKRKRLDVGDIVRIIEGPFTGINGEVVIDKGREIVIKLQMFGRVLTTPMLPELLSPDRQRVVKAHA